jgi:hypothetical protein
MNNLHTHTLNEENRQILAELVEAACVREPRTTNRRRRLSDLLKDLISPNTFFIVCVEDVYLTKPDNQRGPTAWVNSQLPRLTPSEIKKLASGDFAHLEHKMKFLNRADLELLREELTHHLLRTNNSTRYRRKHALIELQLCPSGQ